MKSKKNLVWELFKETGDIKYFLLASKLKESEKNENSRCKRVSIKRD